MKNKVIANATIVTGLSVAERGLGFLYRVALSRLIGAEGLGLYQIALSLFGLFITIGTGGIPITVSRMISKAKADGDPQGERRAVGAGITACLLSTLPFALLFALFGGKFSFLFSDQRGGSVFRILLIGLSLSAVYAVIRGSFWGNKQFLLPSVVEILEESVMVIAGILLLQSVSSPLDGAKKAAWAVVISYVFSFTLSLAVFFVRGGRFSVPKKELKTLFNASLPITSVRASTSLVTSAIAVLLPVMLVRSGLSETDALTTFGVVSGMVLPVLFVPSTVIGSLALVLVPELSEDFYKNNQKRLRANLAKGLKFSFLVACAIIPFFFALGEDLGAFAFSNPLAGEMIKKGCLLLLPMSLMMITNAMLNSMGFEKQTFAFYFIGAATLIVCILILPRFCGGYAYIVGLFASYLLTAILSLVFLLKKCLVSKKRRGQVLVEQYFPLFFGIFPIAFFGKLLHNILQLYTGAVLSAALCFLAMAAVTLVYYFALGEITPPKVFFKRRKHRANS